MHCQTADGMLFDPLCPAKHTESLPFLKLAAIRPWLTVYESTSYTRRGLARASRFRAQSARARPGRVSRAAISTHRPEAPIVAAVNQKPASRLSVASAIRPIDKAPMP